MRSKTRSLVKGDRSKPGMFLGFKEGRRGWVPTLGRKGRGGRGWGGGWRRGRQGNVLGSSNQQRLQELGDFISDSSSQKLMARNLPTRFPHPFSASCSSQMFWAQGFARLRAAAGPARECFLFFIPRQRVTYVFMLSNASHLVRFVFSCLWYHSWPFNVALYALHRQTSEYLIPFHSMVRKCWLWAMLRGPPDLHTPIAFLRTVLPKARPPPTPPHLILHPVPNISAVNYCNIIIYTFIMYFSL